MLTHSLKSILCLTFWIATFCRIGCVPEAPRHVTQVLLRSWRTRSTSSRAPASWAPQAEKHRGRPKAQKLRGSMTSWGASCAGAPAGRAGIGSPATCYSAQLAFHGLAFGAACEVVGATAWVLSCLHAVLDDAVGSCTSWDSRASTPAGKNPVLPSGSRRNQ